MAHLIPWSKLLEDGELCDMHILCQDGEKIPAHKLILSAQSQAIKEAIDSHRPSEGDLVFHADHPANIVRHTVKAIYSGKFEPFDDPPTSVKQENPVGSADNSGSEKESSDGDHRHHQMMFCAQSIRLFYDLRLYSFSRRLHMLAKSKLMKISAHNTTHVDYPAVVEYSLKHNYPNGLSMSDVPWFTFDYKDNMTLRKVLRPILLKHPDALDAMCSLLAMWLTCTESECASVKADLENAKQEVSALKLTITKSSESSGSSTKPSLSDALRDPFTQAFASGPQVGSKRPRNG